ncbi:MAG: undecaprenyl diphosphate synthase family protein, partial [Algiphilus sp.]
MMASRSTTPEHRARPRHVAVIMDGNGRWASQRGRPRALGHRVGVQAARRIVEAAADRDVPYL